MRFLELISKVADKWDFHLQKLMYVEKSRKNRLMPASVCCIIINDLLLASELFKINIHLDENQVSRSSVKFDEVDHHINGSLETKNDDDESFLILTTVSDQFQMMAKIQLKAFAYSFVQNDLLCYAVHDKFSPSFDRDSNTETSMFDEDEISIAESFSGKSKNDYHARASNKIANNIMYFWEAMGFLPGQQGLAKETENTLSSMETFWDIFFSSDVQQREQRLSLSFEIPKFQGRRSNFVRVNKDSINPRERKSEETKDGLRTNDELSDSSYRSCGKDQNPDYPMDLISKRMMNYVPRIREKLLYKETYGNFLLHVFNMCVDEYFCSLYTFCPKASSDLEGENSLELRLTSDKEKLKSIFRRFVIENESHEEVGEWMTGKTDNQKKSEITQISNIKMEALTMERIKEKINIHYLSYRQE